LEDVGGRQPRLLAFDILRELAGGAADALLSDRYRDPCQRASREVATELLLQLYEQMKSDRQPIVVPVMAEQLEISKREVERLGVRLTKTISERTATVEVPLIEERTEVVRVEVNRAVDAAPVVRYEGDTMIVPVLEEVLVTEKRLMLREELHIRKWQVQARVPHNIILRREHIAVERPQNDAAAGSKETEK
jgi:uncharacterized protein (TIGR02271 family)